MIQKYSWVCSECGQGLTRKNTANRHNNNLHSGQAAVVRPFEYMIGRLNGNFHTPKDPLTYPFLNPITSPGTNPMPAAKDNPGAAIIEGLQTVML